MPIAGSREVAALIESKRRGRGISVTELARRIGVDGKRLWYVLHGQREMRVDELVKLCAFFDLVSAASSTGRLSSNCAHHIHFARNDVCPSAIRSAGFLFVSLVPACERPLLRHAVHSARQTSTSGQPLPPLIPHARREPSDRTRPRKLFRRGASFQDLRKTQALPGFASSLARPPEPRTADGPRGGAKGPADKT